MYILDYVIEIVPRPVPVTITTSHYQLKIPNSMATVQLPQLYFLTPPHFYYPWSWSLGTTLKRY